MVRGRKVRTLVACTKGTDNIESPKRKDQRLDFSDKLTQNFVTTNGIVKSQIITDYFQVVHIDNKKSEDIKNEFILELPVTPTKNLEIIDDESKIFNEEDCSVHNICNISDKIENKNEEMKSASITPHRIELVPDAASSPPTSLSHLHIAPPIKKPENPKARRKLNINHSVSKNTNEECNKQINSNHTLTEYFPVRRSIRKTKRIVQEEKQRNIELCIRKKFEEGLEVHNFLGKGRGIVACQPFQRGDFVVEYYGELIDIAEAKRREMKYAKDKNTGCYMYYFKYNGIQYCIDATAENGRLGRLVNHSRNGNLTTKTITVDGIPRLVLIAKDDIAEGEEVTYDYGDRSRESLRYHPWLAT